MDKRRIVAVDIGTSSIRACLFDVKMNLLWSISRKIELQYLMDDHTMLCEMDQEKLWNDFVDLVTESVEEAGGSENVLSLGICTQRNTFISWNSDNFTPCHQMIVWKDCRSKDLCHEWNNSWTMKLLNGVGKTAHFLTRIERFKAAKMYCFMPAMVTHRFVAVLDKNQDMKKLLRQGKLAIGCIETWLLLKLTNGKTVAAEASCASATGLFDPFVDDWGHTILKLIRFPSQVLPKILDSTIPNQALAVADPSIFGFPLPIGGILGDQQAAAFGMGCRTKGSVKISLGTGSFLNLITGSSPHASMYGLYPLIAWRIRGKPVYLAEGKSDDTASLLQWALKIGLCESVEATSDLAKKAGPDSELYFVPAFGGLQTPINDNNACCAFMGLRPETTKEQMIRAILESIAFRVYQIWQTLEEEVDYEIGSSVGICGGVANNVFIIETISTLLGKRLSKSLDGEFSSAKGVALMAAISCGLFTYEESAKFAKIDRYIEPDSKTRPVLLKKFKKWNRAVDRCLHFYDKI